MPAAAPAAASRRELLRLAVPALGALAAEPLYVLADTAIVARLGTPQLGGLGIAATILLTSYTVFIFLAYGTTGAVARRMGAGDARGGVHLAIQGMWLALGLALVMMVILGLAGPGLIRLLGGEGDVAVKAEIYLRISVLGLPALFVTMAGTGYLRGVADARTPLLVAVGSALANLLIQVGLIYGLDQGIGASALSTVIAQTGAAAVYLTVVRRGARRLGVSVRPDVAVLRQLGGIGRDLVVRTAALRLAFGGATAVAARLGVVPLAAHHIAFEIWTFIALALDAVAIAGQTIIGTRLGAGDRDGARATGLMVTRWGLAQGVLWGLTVAALRHPLSRVFTDDPDVRAVVADLLLWVAVLLPVAGAAYALDGVLIGAGDLRYMARAMAGVAAVFLVAAGAVLALDAGIGWLWAAIGLLMTGRLLTLLLRFRGDRWLVLGAQHP